MSLIVLDVRTPEEYAHRHVEGAINVDIRSAGFGPFLASLPKDQEYITYCNAGGRGGRAASMMKDLGFEDVTGCGIIKAGLLAGRSIQYQDAPSGTPPVP